MRLDLIPRLPPLLRILAPLLLAFAVSPASAQDPAIEGISGQWFAETEGPKGLGLQRIEVRVDDAGKPRFSVYGQMRHLSFASGLPLSLTEEGFSATIPLGPFDVYGFVSGPVEVEATLLNDGSHLRVQYANQNGDTVIVYERPGAKFDRYRYARPASDGSAATRYVYSQPITDTSDALRVAHAAAHGIDVPRLESRFSSEILRSDYSRLTSFLLMHRGELIVEEYFRGNHANFLYNQASVTKSFTSALLGRALQDGHIKDLDAPVMSYFPDYGDTLWAREQVGGRTLNIRARDMLKFGQLVLQGGRWAGTQVIPGHYLEEAVTVARIDDDGDDGYGYQFWLKRIASGEQTLDLIVCNGYGGQRIVVIPELEIVAAATGLDYDDSAQRGAMTLLYEMALPLLTGAAEPYREIPLAADDRGRSFLTMFRITARTEVGAVANVSRSAPGGDGQQRERRGGR